MSFSVIISTVSIFLFRSSFVNNSRLFMHLVLLSLFCILPCRASYDELKWQVVKGKHFCVNYIDDKGFAQMVLSASEGYYKGIAHDLGFKKFDNFWTWENRAKIYIFADKASFKIAANAPDWAGAKSIWKNKSVLIFRGNNELIDSALPHELTHLVFRDFIGFKGVIPLWLEEGVAQWEEPAKRKDNRATVKRLMGMGRLFSLKTLMGMNVNTLVESDCVSEFYIQSMSIVGYLMEEYGVDKFRKLCSQIRDGKDMDEALRFTYPQSVRSIIALEEKWKAYIAK